MTAYYTEIAPDKAIRMQHGNEPFVHIAVFRYRHNPTRAAVEPADRMVHFCIAVVPIHFVLNRFGLIVIS